MNTEGDGRTIVVLDHALDAESSLREALAPLEDVSVTVAESDVFLDAVADGTPAVDGRDEDGILAVLVPDNPPERDGVAVGRALRRAGLDVPLVLVAETTSRDRVAAGRTAGFSDVAVLDTPEQVQALAGTLAAYAAAPMVDGTRLDAQWEAIAGTLAHDVKNPLNVLIGRLDLLDLDGRHGPALDRSLDRIGSLLDELSTLATVAGLATELESVSLDRRARGVWETLDTADATLAVTASEPVRADPDRLTAVLERLFENAVAHSTDPVTVTVEAHPGGFAVVDDGPGIPDDERERVFEQGYTTAADGDGYGLFVALVACSAQGWTISATESEAGGTRITVDTGRPAPVE